LMDLPCLLSRLKKRNSKSSSLELKLTAEVVSKMELNKDHFILQ